MKYARGFHVLSLCYRVIVLWFRCFFLFLFFICFVVDQYSSIGVYFLECHLCCRLQRSLNVEGRSVIVYLIYCERHFDISRNKCHHNDTLVHWWGMIGSLNLYFDRCNVGTYLSTPWNVECWCFMTVKNHGLNRICMLRYSDQPFATSSRVSKYISHVFIHFFLNC